MIQSINEVLCVRCGLCEAVCPTDVIRSRDGKLCIEYPDDCCNCMECLFICPTEAIILVPGAPEKFDIGLRWRQIKSAPSKPG